jgi:phosphonate transport system substrate-binding protein
MNIVSALYLLKNKCVRVPMPIWHMQMGFFFTMIFLSGCGASPEKVQYRPRFAIDSTVKKTIIFGVPNPIFYDEESKLVKYLNERLGGSVQVRCVAYRSLDAYLAQLNDGKFDFTICNGVAALKALRKGYSIACKRNSDSAYYGVIFVNKDSAINKVADLKGKTLSLCGRSALAGSMMPLLYLHTHGVNVNKDLKFLFAPSFESTILNVYLGKSSAGAAWVVIWRQFVEQRPEIADKVAIKWVTSTLPDNALLINDKLDPKTRAKLLDLLLGVNRNDTELAAVKYMGATKTGFEIADSNTYAPTKAFYTEYKSIIH